MGLDCWTSGVRSIATGRWLPAHLASLCAIWSSATACRQCAGLALLAMLDCSLGEEQICFLQLQGA